MWYEEDDYVVFMHWMYDSVFYNDKKYKHDVLARHSLFEFLNHLDLISYERGYEGSYYEIIMKKNKGDNYV